MNEAIEAVNSTQPDCALNHPAARFARQRKRAEDVGLQDAGKFRVAGFRRRLFQDARRRC